MSKKKLKSLCFVAYQMGLHEIGRKTFDAWFDEVVK